MGWESEMLAPSSSPGKLSDTAKALLASKLLPLLKHRGTKSKLTEWWAFRRRKRKTPSVATGPQ